MADATARGREDDAYLSGDEERVKPYGGDVIGGAGSATTMMVDDVVDYAEATAHDSKPTPATSTAASLAVVTPALPASSISTPTTSKSTRPLSTKSEPAIASPEPVPDSNIAVIENESGIFSGSTVAKDIALEDTKFTNSYSFKDDSASPAICPMTECSLPYSNNCSEIEKDALKEANAGVLELVFPGELEQHYAGSNSSIVDVDVDVDCVSAVERSIEPEGYDAEVSDTDSSIEAVQISIENRRYSSSMRVDSRRKPTRRRSDHFDKASKSYAAKSKSRSKDEATCSKKLKLSFKESSSEFEEDDSIAYKSSALEAESKEMNSIPKINDSNSKGEGSIQKGEGSIQKGEGYIQKGEGSIQKGEGSIQKEVLNFVKVEENISKLVESDTKNIEYDMKGVESDKKVAESDMKVAESNMKVAESVLKGVESDLNGVESDMKGVESDMKGVESDMKGVESDMKVAESDMKVAESDKKVAESDIKDVECEIMDVDIIKEEDTIPMSVESIPKEVESFPKKAESSLIEESNDNTKSVAIADDCSGRNKLCNLDSERFAPNASESQPTLSDQLGKRATNGDAANSTLLRVQRAPTLAMDRDSELAVTSETRLEPSHTGQANVYAKNNASHPCDIGGSDSVCLPLIVVNLFIF